MTKILKNN